MDVFHPEYARSADVRAIGEIDGIPLLRASYTNALGGRFAGLLVHPETHLGARRAASPVSQADAPLVQVIDVVPLHALSCSNDMHGDCGRALC